MGRNPIGLGGRCALLGDVIEDAGDRGPRVAEELTWRATLGAHVRAEHWLSGLARARLALLEHLLQHHITRVELCSLWR